MLKTDILGTNGLYPKDGINTCGYLVRYDGKTVLCDIGSGCFSALSEIFEPEKVDAVFISHLHYDHTADLGVYNYYLERLHKKGLLKSRIKVFLKNDGSDGYKVLKSMEYFDFRDIKEGPLNDGSGFSFTPMRHPGGDFALTVTTGDMVFSYLGDSNVCGNLEKVMKTSDVVICHAPFLSSEWSTEKPHISMRKALTLAKNGGTVAVCSHFLPDCDTKALKKEAESTKARYVFAKQGETYEFTKKDGKIIF